MIRHPDWRAALQVRARALDGCPFRWGATDCAVLSLNLIDSMLGTDHAARARGCYGSTKAALRWQRQVETIADALTDIGAVRTTAPPSVGDVLLGYRYPYWCAHVMINPFYVMSSSMERGVHQMPAARILAEPEVMVCRF